MLCHAVPLFNCIKAVLTHAVWRQIYTSSHSCTLVDVTAGAGNYHCGRTGSLPSSTRFAVEASQDLTQKCFRIAKGLFVKADKISLSMHEPAVVCRLLLALGGVDCTIRLALAPPGGKFVQVCSLTGHADWVRSLAFTRPPPADAAADAAAESQAGEML